MDVAPLVPELANFFDDVLDKSVSELNLKVPFLLSFSKICGQMQFVSDKLLFGLVMSIMQLTGCFFLIVQSRLLVELSSFQFQPLMLLLVVE